jgi:cytochrome P450
VQNDEHVIYFGIGKRRCVGEILGRAETFLFTLGLVQAFKFEAMPGAEYPDLKYRKVHKKDLNN